MRIAQIASLPNRVDLLKRTVESLKNQVDILNVFLNNYKEIPEFLTYQDNVYAMIMDNSTGDAAKFKGVEEKDCYFFSCDDDLLYPRDYCDYLIRKIEQYKRRAIITLHGRIMLGKPVRSYYYSKAEVFHCARTVDRDVKVDVGGTGVMAFHTSTLDIKYKDFELPNMADIFLAKVARKHNVPIIVAAHKMDYIQLLDPDDTDTIWHKFNKDDKVQTDLYNKI